jgi:hypothetical protein
MKLRYKITLLLSMLLMGGASAVVAQTSGAIVTTQPASFTGEDQVKIIVDVSNVPNLAGVGPLYVWTWFPNEPAPGNGQWDNSNEARKMVQEGPNKWSWTIVPKDFYGVDAAAITQIKFLVKAKDGSGDKKTDDIILNVTPLTFVPSDFRTFPRIVSPTDVVTFYLDQNLTSDLTTQRMKPVQAKIKLFSDNGTQVGAEQTVTLKKEAEKLYSYTLIPVRLFNVSPTANIAKMQVVFVGTIPDATGAPVAATSITFEKAFDNLQ